jgi:hypothetical protein
MAGVREKAPDMTAFNDELIKRTSKQGMKWPDLSGIKKFFTGTMELDPQELMTAYGQWKGWQEKGANTSPDTFLAFLTAPHGNSRRFEKKARPAKGAAEEFKMRYNVQDDVGKAQMQLRR